MKLKFDISEEKSSDKDSNNKQKSAEKNEKNKNIEHI